MRNINGILIAEVVAMASFSERLRTLRAQRGLTQDGLAAAIGVSRSTIAGYEAPSKERQPDFDVVRRLADFFDVAVDYLLGRTDDPHVITPEDEARSRELDRLLADEQIYLDGEALTVEEKQAILDFIKLVKKTKARCDH